MFTAIESAAVQLRNAEAGWVTRRDAAELLGKIAAQALAALNESSEEPDADVRCIVDAALAEAAAALQGVAPKAGAGAPTLDDLVRGCEKAGERTVDKAGDGYVVKVKLKTGRSQTIYVRPFHRRDGVNLIQVYTVCGKAEEQSFGWALRANMKLIQGALALAPDGDEERFVLTTSFIAGEASPVEIKAAVKETAYYGDWIEQKLAGTDDL